jgi:hypothetical protein
VVCSRDENTHTQVKINVQILEEVQEFTYLGSKTTKHGRSKKETASRIKQAKNAFTSKNTTLHIRKNLVKAYVWSTALY